MEQSQYLLIPKIGDIVKSRITGESIRVIRLGHGFLIGKLLEYTPNKYSHPMYDGTKILSYKNIDNGK